MFPYSSIVVLLDRRNFDQTENLFSSLLHSKRKGSCLILKLIPVVHFKANQTSCPIKITYTQSLLKLYFVDKLMKYILQSLQNKLVIHTLSNENRLFILSDIVI